ncbi:hypothetical protein ACKVM7_000253 [Arthrobacter russicus]|jgi:type IV secretion system protein TrbL
MGWFSDFLSGLFSGVVATVDFLKDPLGFIFRGLAAANGALVKDLIPSLSKASLPDLTLDWFVRAYSISFAIAILLWGLIQLYNLYLVSKGRVSGADFLTGAIQRTGVFFGGAAFGPLLGIFLISGIRLLTDALVTAGIATSIDNFYKTMGMVIGIKADLVFGGVIVGIFIMLFMFLGLLVMVLVLVVMLVTLYFSSVMFPIGWAWYTSASHESFAKKIPMVFLLILLAHPLMFFFLGIAFSMLSVIGQGFSDGAQWFMTSLAAITAFGMTVLVPMRMLKFAAISPGIDLSGAADDPSLPGVPGPGSGPGSLQEAQTQAASEPSTDAANDGNPAPGGQYQSAGESFGSGPDLNETPEASAPAAGQEQAAADTTATPNSGSGSENSPLDAGADAAGEDAAQTTGAEQAGKSGASGAGAGAAAGGIAAAGVTMAAMAAKEAFDSGMDAAQAGPAAMDAVDENA